MYVGVVVALRRLAIAHLSGSNVFHLLEARGWELRYRSGSCVFVCKAAIAGLSGREPSGIAPSSGSRSLGLLNQLSFNAISVTANSIPHSLLCD
eukprot:COSAG02_NODE_405_length_23022_cov_14.617764_14_plen_94_part_00